ncbi:MAG: dicarboxylate/amino acid:cation symporter [Crocinitomicaceae bacterium]|nr:dicarboxylate/amino acid:cation symporter [Crocinitomicaceae bacterium]MDG1777075.1 dicarboxylate/amino acid:cation symporter [Crocinitomicaceae bacterium]
MGKLALHWKILIAMALGVIWSLISGAYGLNGFTSDWIDPFGTIFINILKFIAIPLVLFSIVTGVSGLGDPSQLGRMGAKTLGLYLITTVFSVSMGLVIVNVFVPGANSNKDTKITHRLEYEVWAHDNNIEVKDGRNVMATVGEKELAEIRVKLNSDMDTEAYQKMSQKNTQKNANKSQGPLQPLVDMVPSNLVQALGNGKLMLQVIFFALFFGVAIIMMPKDKTASVRGFFDDMNEVFVKMVHIVMNFAPFFVFCLMAGVLAKSADTLSELMDIFIQLGFYALIVFGGLMAMLFGFYPLLLKVFGVKIGYREFFRGMSAAQFLAFSTSSSAATLPVTIECVNENLKVPEKVSDFVLPIGATVNMDGTSLYQAVAVIFLAQYHDVDLSMMQQLGIVATATLASIGAAAVPSAGLIMLMIVLDSIGLNPLWVAIVFPVDRILDMCRTVINVTSDATVSAIIAKSEKLMD